MLDDAIDAWLNSVSERWFYEPLLALLRTEGYTDLHLVHPIGAHRAVVGRRVLSPSTTPLPSPLATAATAAAPGRAARACTPQHSRCSLLRFVAPVTARPAAVAIRLVGGLPAPAQGGAGLGRAIDVEIAPD